MAYRVTTYEDAFVHTLDIQMDGPVKAFIAKMESQGHTEKGICFAIWKKQDKLFAYKRDKRFWTILENEINKWSWPKGDPRWEEYWKRKREEARAANVRKEIDAMREQEEEQKLIESRAKKPPKKTKGYVYFIQGECGGAIKVGYSANPEKRLKELQTGYPDTLILLLMIPGTESTERALHREFESSRLNGEWFRPDKQVIDRIKELTAKYGFKSLE